MREIILISFLGPDQPNQFTRLMQVLSVHSLHILDVGQAVIHNQLTLGIVVASDDETATALAMKEILILAHDIGLTVRFKPISSAEYDQWVSEGGRTRYIVTALAPELTASHLQAVTKIVSDQGFNIETVTRLSGRPKTGFAARCTATCLCTVWFKWANARCSGHARGMFKSFW